MVRTTKFSADEIPDLTGLVALVTGTSPGGIGAETAKQLALHGAKVYLASRNEGKNKQAKDEILAAAPAGTQLQLETLSLDLADLAAVRKAADEFKSREKALHILVLNAGVMACPKAFTKDGWETQFQTNYLSHFLFAKELLPVLENGAATRADHRPSRVISLSSIGHHIHRLYPFASPSFKSKDEANRSLGPGILGAYVRYSQAKLAAILFAREWNRRIARPGGGKVWASSVHPGPVQSNLYVHTPGGSLLQRALLRTPDGALSSLYAATSAELEEEDSFDVYRGEYGLQHRDSPQSRDPKLAADLWTLSEDAVKEFASVPPTPAAVA